MFEIGPTRFNVNKESALGHITEPGDWIARGKEILFKAAVIKKCLKECVNSASGKRKQSWGGKPLAIFAFKACCCDPIIREKCLIST